MGSSPTSSSIQTTPGWLSGDSIGFVSRRPSGPRGFESRPRLHILERAAKKELKMAVKMKNLMLALWDQLPLWRFIRNFFVTRNALGLFHKNSHVSRRSGKPKVMYGTKQTATKSAEKMGERHGTHFSNYKCLYCDGYHIGRNKGNK